MKISIKLYSKDRGQLVENASFEVKEDYATECYNKRGHYINKLSIKSLLEKLGYVEVVDLGCRGTYRINAVKREYTKRLTDANEDFYFATVDPDDLDARDLLDDYQINFCEHCETYFDDSTACYDYDDNCYCSYDCRSEECFYCSDCENWYPTNRYNSYETTNGDLICEDCSENYCYCENCERFAPTDECSYDEDACEYVCDNCCNNHIIGSYHRQKKLGFTKQYSLKEKQDNNYSNLLMGFELECECKGNYHRDEVAEKVDSIVNKNTKLFDFETDGSLSSNGYETISMPCTLNWYYENESMLKQMLNTMIGCGCISHRTSNCGLHIHFDKKYIDYNDDIATRIVYIFEKLKEPLKKFSRRTTYTYCHFISDTDTNELTMKYIKDTKDDYDRYMAVNLQNSNTIEIRLFRGTLKFESLYSALEFVQNIVDYAMDKTDKDTEKVTFKDIVNYKRTKYLKDYCISRNLI